MITRLRPSIEGLITNVILKSMNHKNKFSNYTKSQLLTAINESIIGFKARRNRDMVKRKLCDGLTFEEIAEEFDMSVRQTKTIIYEQELKIVKYLE